MGGCLNTSDKWLWGSGGAPLCTSLQQAEEGLKRWALRREGGCSQRLADGRALLCLPLHLVWSGLREAQCSGVPTRGQHTAALWLFYSLEELSWVPLAPPQLPASFLSHFSEPITPLLRSFHPPVSAGPGSLPASQPDVSPELGNPTASLTSQPAGQQKGPPAVLFLLPFSARSLVWFPGEMGGFGGSLLLISFPTCVSKALLQALLPCFVDPTKSPEARSAPLRRDCSSSLQHNTRMHGTESSLGWPLLLLLPGKPRTYSFRSYLSYTHHANTSFSTGEAPSLRGSAHSSPSLPPCPHTSSSRKTSFSPP